MIELPAIASHHKKLRLPEKLSLLKQVAIHVFSRVNSVSGLKAQFYRRLLGYMSFIGHKISQYPENQKALEKPYGDNARALNELLFHLDVLTLLDQNFKPKRSASSSAKLEAWENDYNFVRNLTALYRKTPPIGPFPNSRKWQLLISRSQLDYEIRLSETLHELVNLHLPNKIPSPFSEAYYTESGRNAFHNFTRPRFTSLFRQLDQEHRIRQALDVGCGYGNYLQLLHELDPEMQITGLELQQDVYHETSQKFQRIDSIKVLNQNVLDWQTTERFDLILLNYVLFYFSRDDKRNLFEFLANRLTPNGTVLVCQYYAGIEKLKYALAKKQGNNGLGTSIEQFYANKILYANALWNQTASTFSEAEDWDKFNTDLNKAGLAVKRITNADRFYYSLFLEIKRI